MGLYHRCNAGQAAAVSAWIEALELDPVADRLFVTLSTGQQRLFLLARALVKSPPLLVLDEPCQGLDDHYRQVFLHLVEEICTYTPVTLIYVSHYQDEIPAAVTHQLKISNGAVTEKNKIKSATTGNHSDTSKKAPRPGLEPGT